jgi:hypothetical protein
LAARRVIRGFAIGFGAVVIGALVVLAIGLRLAGPDWLAPLLVELLEREGAAPVALTVERVGLTGVSLRDVALGPGGAIRAKRIAATVSLAGLARGRLAEITVTGARLAATIDADGVAIHGLAAPSGAGLASGGALPPIDRIVLDDAEVTATTALGTARVRLDGAVTLAIDGLASQTELDVALGPQHLTVRRLDLARRPDGGWHAGFGQATLRAPAFGVAAETIDGTLDLSADHTAIAATIGSLHDTGAPARIVPLSARVYAERRGDAVTFDLAAHDAASNLQIAVKGRHALATARGSAEVGVTPKRFAVDRLQPRDLAPVLGAALPPLDGTVTVGGTVAWSRDGLAPALRVSVADLALDLGAARLTGAHGTIALDGVAPPSTPPAQQLAATVALGTAALPLQLGFQLRRDGAVVVSALTIGFADGELAVRDVVVPPRAAGAPPLDLALPVTVSGADLASLLGLVAVDGLSGTGRLDGTLPLRLSRRADGASQIALDHGQLAARGPGLIRYVGDALPAPAGAGAEAVALLRDALKDFHYEGLTLELNRRPDGADDATLHLSGANPAVLNGRKFVLNIRLDADFDRLLAVFLAGLDAAGRLSRELAAPQP